MRCKFCKGPIEVRHGYRDCQRLCDAANPGPDSELGDPYEPDLQARASPAPSAPVLSLDSDERKATPIFSGVLNYFPLAIAAVARLSKRGNDKHNAGQPLHWARDKSTDHPDCIGRHLIDIETLDASGEYEDAAALAWRALAKLQELEERRLGKPLSRGCTVGVAKMDQ